MAHAASHVHYSSRVRLPDACTDPACLEYQQELFYENVVRQAAESPRVPAITRVHVPASMLSVVMRFLIPSLEDAALDVVFLFDSADRKVQLMSHICDHMGISTALDCPADMHQYNIRRWRPKGARASQDYCTWAFNPRSPIVCPMNRHRLGTGPVGASKRKYPAGGSLFVTIGTTVHLEKLMRGSLRARNVLAIEAVSREEAASREVHGDVISIAALPTFAYMREIGTPRAGDGDGSTDPRLHIADYRRKHTRVHEAETTSGVGVHLFSHSANSAASLTTSTRSTGRSRQRNARSDGSSEDQSVPPVDVTTKRAANTSDPGVVVSARPKRKKHKRRKSAPAADESVIRS